MNRSDIPGLEPGPDIRPLTATCRSISEDQSIPASTSIQFAIPRLPPLIRIHPAQVERRQPLTDFELFATLDKTCTWIAKWFRVVASARPCPRFQACFATVVELGDEEYEIWAPGGPKPKRHRPRLDASGSGLAPGPPPLIDADEEPGDRVPPGSDAASNSSGQSDSDNDSSDGDGGESLASGDLEALYAELSDLDSGGATPSEVAASDAESDPQSDAEGGSASDGGEVRRGGSGMARGPAPAVVVPDALGAAAEIWGAMPPPVPAPGRRPSAPAGARSGVAQSEGSQGPGSARASAADASVVLPFGSRIRFYKSTGSFEAVCQYHLSKEGIRCRLTRTAAPSIRRGREGQGRPLGFMAAWCNLCIDCDTSQAEHRDPVMMSLATRKR